MSPVGPPRGRLRQTLVTLEIALSLVLLSAAGLLIESFWHATRVDLGFRPDQVLSMRFNLPAKYDTAQRVEAFREELLRRVSALPGVEFAGTNSAPPMGAMMQNTDFEIEGKPQTGSTDRSASFSNVSTDYLRAMGIPVMRGRGFERTDRPGSPPVAIVGQSVAREFFAGEEILGKRIRLGRFDGGQWCTVIGVAADVRESRPESPPNRTIYALSSQLPPSQQGSAAAHMIVLVLRSGLVPFGLAKSVRAEVAGMDKDQPVGDVLTMRRLVDQQLAGRRLNTVLIALFAALAVMLAGVGVFGVVSYSVSCRTHEIGIRMALGATRSTILGMITRETLGFGLAGVGAGALASLGASRLIASMLYGVAPAAPHILFGSAAFLVAAVIGAILFGSRRVLELDPTAALRHE